MCGRVANRSVNRPIIVNKSTVSSSKPGLSVMIDTFLKMKNQIFLSNLSSILIYRRDVAIVVRSS